MVKTKNPDETIVLGACPQDCPDCCSMLVSVKKGRVTGVRGNPDHPFTAGRLCVKVQDYEKRVHNEQRVLYPLMRNGPKGSGEFKRVTWDFALSKIKSHLDKTISEYGASSVLPYSYLGTQGILNGLNV